MGFVFSRAECNCEPGRCFRMAGAGVLGDERRPVDEDAKAPGDVLAGRLAVLFGLLTAPALGISFTHSGNVLSILAIVVGVLLFLGK
jgi:hypothetical protein